MAQTFLTYNLDLDQIADSGQVFRWLRLGDGRYLIPSGSRETEARQDGNRLYLSCSEEDAPFWHSYFDLDTDYGRIIRSCRRIHDSYLNEAMIDGSSEEGRD